MLHLRNIKLFNAILYIRLIIIINWYQAFDDFNKKALEECKTCGRTFLPRALEVHSRSKCKPRPDPNTNNNVNGGSGTTRNGYSR